MANRGWIFATIAASALWGCAAESPIRAQRPNDECHPGQCTIAVTVKNDNCMDAANIVVSIPVMKVPKENQRIPMFWVFKDTPGNYTFAGPENTITFTSSPRPEPWTFDGQRVSPDGRRFQLINANPETAPVDYKYNIQLLNNGIPCKRLDPSIRNGAN